MSANSRGARRYSNPRYRSGSRAKPHQIVARPVRRNPPDLGAFGRAFVQAAVNQAAVQSGDGCLPAVRPKGRGRSNSRPFGRGDQVRKARRG
jgi:hypothetical protein